MKIIAFEYGKTEITERMAFQDGRADVKLPIALLFFMIEAEDKKILVDVGCDTMPGFVLYEHKSPPEVLKMYGVSPDEITDIIITHSHHDHIDAIRHYPDARVYIHESETSDMIKGFNVSTFSDSLEIAEGVTAVYIGGHSEGSSIFMVGEYVLCGDECYTMENLINNKPTGSSFCLEKSIAFVNEYRKSKYKPILFHDPELVGSIKYKIIEQ